MTVKVDSYSLNVNVFGNFGFQGCFLFTLAMRSSLRYSFLERVYRTMLSVDEYCQKGSKCELQSLVISKSAKVSEQLQ